jgi:hypothetical protein
MIRYALACGGGHEFESWFQSAASYDTLAATEQLSCPDCGDTKIAKSLMSPGVSPSRRGVQAKDAEERPLSKPRTEAEVALAELRKAVEANSDYVGLRFAAEARAMHEGDIPTRSIYGEARLDEAKRLLEDGVPVAPLPFRPRSRAN